MFEKIRSIIANELNIDESKITLESSLAEDLGADSLDAMQLIMSLEDEYGIQISDDDAKSIHTVNDVIELVNKLK